jgi:hypothetical protein
MNRIFAFSAALLLGGCLSTAAQVEGKRINDTLAEGNAARRACVEQLEQSPPARALGPKLAMTVESKANTQKATLEDAADIKALQPYAARCRELDLTFARQVSPNAAAVYSASFAKLDNNTARLISRQITWGEYNIERSNISAERSGQMATELASVRRDLSTAHEAEVRRTQSILARTADSMPKQTNCTAFGGYINCTTY